MSPIVPPLWIARPLPMADDVRAGGGRDFQDGVGGRERRGQHRARKEAGRGTSRSAGPAPRVLGDGGGRGWPWDGGCRGRNAGWTPPPPLRRSGTPPVRYFNPPQRGAKRMAEATVGGAGAMVDCGGSVGNNANLDVPFRVCRLNQTLFYTSFFPSGAGGKHNWGYPKVYNGVCIPVRLLFQARGDPVRNNQEGLGVPLPGGWAGTIKKIGIKNSS